MYLPRTAILLPVLLASFTPGCSLPGKVCIGACDGDGDDTAAESTDGASSTPEVPSTGTTGHEIEPGGVSSTGGADPTTTAESGNPDSGSEETEWPPLPGCDIPDTLPASNTCSNGVAEPAEICFENGFGGTEEPVIKVVSSIAAALDPGGLDLVLSLEDGSVVNALDGVQPNFDLHSVDWAAKFDAPIILTGVGDLDGNGHDDIVGRVPGDGADSVEMMFIGAGAELTGGFGFGEQKLLFGPAVADWDQDGNLDLVVIRSAPDIDQVVPWLGDGTGEFTQGSGPGFTIGDDDLIAMAALDDDGIADDFVFVDPTGGTQILISGPGDLVYFNALESGLTARDVKTGDLDGDGHGDVVVLAEDIVTGTAAIYVLLQLPGNADFATAKFQVECGATTLGLGTLDGDDALDIVVAGHRASLTIRRNDGHGGFDAVMSTGFDKNFDSLHVVDGSGDGFTDILATSRTTGATLYMAGTP